MFNHTLKYSALLDAKTRPKMLFTDPIMLTLTIHRYAELLFMLVSLMMMVVIL